MPIACHYHDDDGVLYYIDSEMNLFDKRRHYKCIRHCRQWRFQATALWPFLESLSELIAASAPGKVTSHQASYRRMAIEPSLMR